jgi:peptidase E
MAHKQFVIGSGDLSPQFTYEDSQAELGPIAHYLMKLSGKTHPKICYIGTAAGDSMLWISRFYDACSSHNIEASHLQLFKKPNHEDVRKHLLNQDIIWVAGGSTANLLAVWKVHDLMDILLEAQAQGTILSGYSAGCVCWSVGGTCDSWGDMLRPLINEDGQLPYSMCVHYDNEPRRRPLYLELIKDGTLPAGYATEEGVSIHFIDGKIHKIITDTPGQAAYYVHRDKNHKVIEERLEPELLRASRQQ